MTHFLSKSKTYFDSFSKWVTKKFFETYLRLVFKMNSNMVIKRLYVLQNWWFSTIIFPSNPCQIMLLSAFDSLQKWVCNTFLKKKNFHHEGVKWGTFGHMLGVWEAKWHLNHLSNICRHLSQISYIKIMMFLYCNLTPYLNESCRKCKMNLRIKITILLILQKTLWFTFQ